MWRYRMLWVQPADNQIVLCCPRSRFSIMCVLLHLHNNLVPLCLLIIVCFSTCASSKHATTTSVAPCHKNYGRPRSSPLDKQAFFQVPYGRDYQIVRYLLFRLIAKSLVFYLHILRHLKRSSLNIDSSLTRSIQQMKRKWKSLFNSPNVLHTS